MHFQHWKTILIVIAVWMSACAICAPTSTRRQPAQLFDCWSSDVSTNGITNVFGAWISPDGKHKIICLGSDIDTSDALILIGRDMDAAKEVVLGYGMRGFKVKWFQTKAGHLAVIDQQTDNGMNELYVVLPRQFKNRVEWDLLYRTPDCGRTADHRVVAHCYWSVVKLDPDLGSLRLKASWDFSNITNVERKKLKTEGVYEIPLFYGALRN